MNDLKTLTEDDNQQTGLLTIVMTFSDDIKTEFGLDKCAKATFKRGRLSKTTDLQLDVDKVTEELEQEKPKYLGANEGDGIQHSAIKEKIRKEYYTRVHIVLKTELNAANKFEAINTLAIPVVTYSFNIINWKLSDTRMDAKTRKMLTTSKMHHPKSDVDRLYLPRTSGGRGLVQLELSLKTTTIGLNAYLTNNNDPLLQIVKYHEQRKKLYSATKEAAKFCKELGIPEISKDETEVVTAYAKRVKKMAQHYSQQKLQESWEEKMVRAKYSKRLKDTDVDQQKTNQWLRSTGLKGETEGLMIEAQYLSPATRSYHLSALTAGSAENLKSLLITLSRGALY